MLHSTFTIYSSSVAHCIEFNVCFSVSTTTKTMFSIPLRSFDSNSSSKSKWSPRTRLDLFTFFAIINTINSCDYLPFSVRTAYVRIGELVNVFKLCLSMKFGRLWSIVSDVVCLLDETNGEPKHKHFTENDWMDGYILHLIHLSNAYIEFHQQKRQNKWRRRRVWNRDKLIFEKLKIYFVQLCSIRPSVGFFYGFISINHESVI